MNSDRWYRWLLCSSLFFVAFGVVTALAPHSIFLSPWTQAVDFWLFQGSVPPQVLTLRSFMMALLGATIAGSYLLQTFVVVFAFRRGEKWAWHAILWSNVLWFLVDSSMSLHYGAYFNIYMINIFPLVVFGIPLFATRSMLKRETS